MSYKIEYCARRLFEKGFWAYYTHETSRDKLLKKSPTVINIFTNADLLQISRLFSDITYRQDCEEHAFLIRGNLPVRFRVSDFPMDRVVHVPGSIDIERSACKHATETFLFNIDCFFYDCVRKVFYDPLDVYQVFKNGIISTIITPDRAAERYPTIALKTAKVMSETGFEIDKSLYDFLLYNKSIYDYEKLNCSVVDDFIDIIVSGRAFEALVLLNNLGVLDQLLPEVTLLHHVNQDKDHHPEGNGFWHTLECMRCVKKPTKTLMMAVLLHDTGKAVTLTSRKKHKPFPNHSSASTQISKNVLRRFSFTGEEMEEIFFLVRNHMILDAIDRLPETRLRRLFLSPYFPNLLELYRADLQSGYHNMAGYYYAARAYRAFLRREKMWREGVYA